MNDENLEYRVIRRNTEDDSNWYSVEEVYFDDDGTPIALSIDLAVEGTKLDEMKTQLKDMMVAFELPILNEIDIVPTPSPEVCEGKIYERLIRVEDKLDILIKEND